MALPYGQFVDYAQRDDGAYDFMPIEGPPVTLFGEPAEALKARLDAARAGGLVLHGPRRRLA